MTHADLAWLAWHCYEPAHHFRELCGLRRLELVGEPIDRNGSQAFLVRTREGDPHWPEPWASITFRGTQASEFRPRDLWSNLTWPWPTRWQGVGRVHSGYRRHLNMIPEVLPLAEQVASDVPLFVDGHSMGGTLATLLAAWYYTKRPAYKLAGLVTFGAPKAVDAKAASAIECPIARYTVDGDFAALWPPVWGLIHPARAITLPPRSARHGPLRRHSAEGYYRAVNEHLAVRVA